MIANREKDVKLKNQGEKKHGLIISLTKRLLEQNRKII